MCLGGENASGTLVARGLMRCKYINDMYTPQLDWGNNQPGHVLEDWKVQYSINLRKFSLYEYGCSVIKLAKKKKKEKKREFWKYCSIIVHIYKFMLFN